MWVERLPYVGGEASICRWDSMAAGQSLFGRLKGLGHRKCAHQCFDGLGFLTNGLVKE